LETWLLLEAVEVGIKEVQESLEHLAAEEAVAI